MANASEKPTKAKPTPAVTKKVKKKAPEIPPLAPLPDVSCEPKSKWKMKHLESLKTDSAKLQTLAICLSRKHSPKWIAIKLSGRGKKWLRKKKYDKAAAVFELAVRLDPTYALGYFQRARAGGMLKDVPGTLLWLRRLRAQDTVKAFRCLRWLHKDKDFDPIRQDPAFKAFVATVDALPMLSHRPGEVEKMFPLGATFPYQLTSGESEKKRRIMLKVAANKVISGTRVVKLTTRLKDEWGLDVRPAYHISNTAYLLFADKGVWLSWQDKMSAKDVAATLTEAPTWPQRLHKYDVLPKNPPADTAYHYVSSYRTEYSICRGYTHPSPDTGDFFITAECFTPAKGLTQITVESAWGSYSLRMLHK